MGKIIGVVDLDFASGRVCLCTSLKGSLISHSPSCFMWIGFYESVRCVLQVGRFEVNLISPDSKTVVLEKNFKDISSCCQVGLFLLDTCLCFSPTWQWAQVYFYLKAVMSNYPVFFLLLHATVFCEMCVIHEDNVFVRVSNVILLHTRWLWCMLFLFIFLLGWLSSVGV